MGRRMNLKEAAEVLGSTSEAIRKRAKRGTIPSETGDDGMIYVWVDGRVDGMHDEGSHRVDERVDSSNGQVDDRVDGGDGRVDDHLPAVYRDLMLDQMGSEINHLREQLREEREANRENRRIIAGLVQRVPELETTQEPRDASMTASEPAARDSVPEDQDEPQRRSWWRRLFGE